jgi:hypothetical protein
MPWRQQMFGGFERSRFNQIDHDGRRQHRHAAGADARRGMFFANDKLGGADEAGFHLGQKFGHGMD